MPYRYREPVLSFANHMADINLSKWTITTRCDALKVFVFFLDAKRGKRLQDVDVAMVEKYRQELMKRELKENTINTYFRSVKALYNYLEKSGMIFENPFRMVVMRRVEMPILEILTPDEVKRLLAAVESTTAMGIRNRAMLEVLYATGARKEELHSLSVFDIDTDRETVRVFGKGGKERVLPMGKHASKYVELYLKFGRQKLLGKDIPDDGGILFISSRAGKRPNLDSRFFKPLLEKAGITKHVSYHTFRRTCATHMLQNGAHVLMVAEMLGHGGLETLRRYLKISITELRKTHSKSKPGK